MRKKKVETELPQGFMLALSEILPEVAFGCNSSFISSKVMQWSSINAKLQEFAKDATAKQYGYTYTAVGDEGCLVQVSPEAIVQYTPVIASELGVSIELFDLAQLKKQIQRLRDSERIRLQQVLTDILYDMHTVGCVDVTIGLYTRGGTNQTVYVNGKACGVYKLSVQDLIVVLMQLLRKDKTLCVRMYDTQRGFVDYTGNVRKYIQVVSTTTDVTERMRALQSIANRCIANCGITAFEGTALLYTIEFSQCKK